MTKPTVFIICGVYNQLKSTKKLLDCINKQTYKNVQTIIIDDGSSDGTINYISEYYPNTILLKGDGNLWWTGSLFWGVEEVLKVAKPDDFILTINNDCEVEEDFISILTKTSIDNDKSIVGSLAVDIKNKNRIWDAGVQIDWQKGKLIPLGPEYLKDLPKDKVFQGQIDTLTTKGTLYPIEVFRKIGNFDKIHLPHYASDYEFACRAKKSGFKLLLSYISRVYNDTGRTGIGEKIPRHISLKEYFNLLFSHRSRINIIDNWWFITLCCPMRYKIINYCFLILKSLALFLLVFPGSLPYKIFQLNQNDQK